jgi:hypothetical protein
MIEVRLENEDWQRVLQILATAPWQAANPLIMKIGGQLQAQQPKPNGAGEVAQTQEPPTTRQ